MDQNTVVLEAKNVGKEFFGNAVLKDVNFSLNKGEILAFIGENGAGKSTLMKILSGVHTTGSYSGDILLNGEKVEFHSPEDAHKVGIGMIYQEINLELDLSVAENIFIGKLDKNRFGFVDWKKTYSDAEALLGRLGFEIDVKRKVRNLSASVQQVICIARALHLNPHVLILDEPTSTLTRAETEKLVAVLNQLKQQGISCIYISHKLDEIFSICDRIVVLRDGSVVSGYSKGEYDQGRVIEDIIGRKMEAMYPRVDKELGETVLQVKNLTVQHPSTPTIDIVRGVSFKLRRGEVLGLAGLVGAGRSEVLRGIYGVLPRKDGEIYLYYEKVDIRNAEDAQRHGFALLTEDRKRDGYVGSMDIKKNITLSSLKRIKKGFFIDYAGERAIAEEYFNSFNIKANSLSDNILSLSGGNQQKVMLGKCMAMQPKILLLDEPTRGVDVGAKSEIYGIIASLAAGGMSIIVISSELPELCAICDRFIVMSKGRAVGELDRGEVSEARIMSLAATGAYNNGEEGIN